MPILWFGVVQAIWEGSESAIRCCLSTLGGNALTEAACGSLPNAESLGGVAVTWSVTCINVLG